MRTMFNVGIKGVCGVVALVMCACSGASSQDSPPAPTGSEPTASLGAASESEPARVVGLDEIEVARVDLENGLFVGWYEPAPGVVLVGGNIRYPHQPVSLEPGLSALERFRALAPGREVPEALRAADARRTHYAELSKEKGRPQSPAVRVERVEEMGLGEGSRPGAPVEGIGVQRQAVIDDSACPWSWFENAYCGICRDDANSCGDWKVRWSFRTGTSIFTREDTWWAKVAACSYRGAIHYRVRVQPWYSWSTSVDVIRQTGEGWWWSKDELSIDFDVESRVDQADGDGYHHCGTGMY